MSTTPVNTAPAPWLRNDDQTAKEPAKTNELGKDQFLELLVAELRHQDPMQPMNDKEFISQMATFSQLEQTQNLNGTVEQLASDIRLVLGNSMALQQAGTLIGREVAYVNPSPEGEDDKVLTGVIESVAFKDGIPYFSVGEHQISADYIIEMGKTAEDANNALLNRIIDMLEDLTGEDTPSEEE